MTEPKKRTAFWLAAAAVLFVNAALNSVDPLFIERDLRPIWPKTWLESHFLYLGLMAFTASCPLIFGLWPRLKFWREWPRFFRANWPVAAFFIVWDVFFTRIGVWDFSKTYTLGPSFLGLPIEEWLFFTVVPAACVFIFHSLKCFFPRHPREDFGLRVFRFLAFSFVFVALWNWKNAYTFSTFWLAAGLVFWLVEFEKPRWTGLFLMAFLLSCLPFLLINGTLTGTFTASPVVVYNSSEFLGYRVGTVPIDDFAYSFLLLLGNVWLFEKLGAAKMGG